MSKSSNSTQESRVENVGRTQFVFSKILQAALDEATEPWGIKVERVEM